MKYDLSDAETKELVLALKARAKALRAERSALRKKGVTRALASYARVCASQLYVKSLLWRLSS